jgi:hypothetical protein
VCWLTDIYFLLLLTTIGIQVVGGQTNGTTARVAETRQPLLAVAVTTYVPSTVTCASGPMIAKLLGPVQLKMAPGDVANMVAAQFTQLLATTVVVITGVIVLDVTVVLARVLQPLLPVTVTEYGPAVPTVMLAVVAPVFHR